MILITGATDGIGLALAKLLHKKGERLILVGRRAPTTLTDPLFNSQTYCQADLSLPDHAERIMAFLAYRGIDRLDCVVHNAGLGYVGDTAAQTAASITDLVNVNFTAPVKLTHALLPWLKRAQGQLLFVSSIVTAMATPNFAVYGATKAALDGFVRSLRIELSSHQVGVQLIHPGATKTGMHEKAGFDAGKMRGFASAEAVAKQIAKAISRPRRQRTIGLTNKIIKQVAGLKRVGGKVTPVPQPLDRRPHCVITGAADGIGYQLAHRYAAAGFRITGIDVDVQRAAALQQQLTVAGVTNEIIVADLIDDWAWVEKIQAADVFIHNAGISAAGRFDHSVISRQEAVIRLNLLAPLQLTGRLLHNNTIHNGGSLVFISSLSHHMSYPGAAVYAGTKDGLAHYAHSLRASLYPQQHILTVFPGPIRTVHARRYSPDNSSEANRMPPEKLADLIFEAQQTQKMHLLPGNSAKIAAKLGRATPRLAEYIMRRTLFDNLA